MAVVTKTLKASGGDYSSLSAWEAGEQTDLVAAGDSHVLEFDGFALAEAGGTAIAGWVTGPGNDITIMPAAGQEHGGVRRSDGGSGFEYSATTQGALRILQNYVTIVGGEWISTSSGSGAAISLIGGSNLTIEKNFVIAGNTGTSNPAVTTASGNSSLIFRNNVIESSGRGIDARNSPSAELHNNTVIMTGSGTFGILSDSNIELINNACAGAATEDIFGTPKAGSSNNYTEDGSVGTVFTPTDAFTDYAGGDYSLKSGSDLIDAGADLSVDFTDDIADETRGSTWDVGAYEFVSGPSIISITAIQTESGDITSSSLEVIGISSITANQSEQGDSNLSVFEVIVHILANQPELGDLSAADLERLDVSSISADQTEEETLTAILETTIEILADQLEDGDITPIFDIEAFLSLCDKVVGQLGVLGYTGTIADRLLSYLEDQTGNEGSISDLAVEFKGSMKAVLEDLING